MKIFTRHHLVAPRGASLDDEVLLEGGWPPHERRVGRWSLDEAIDSRFAAIDRQAMALAERAGATAGEPRQLLTPAYINALALRYYLVKLLRVAAFFRDVRPLARGEHVDFTLSIPDDEAYLDVLKQVIAARDGTLALHPLPSPPASSAGPSLREARWRRWMSRAAGRPVFHSTCRDADAPRVVFCGNPRILNPICAELVCRGARLWWLYERFAIRSWWQWRRAGVRQVVCDDGRGAPHRACHQGEAIGGDEELAMDGIDFSRPVERWRAALSAECGRGQSLLVQCVERHFSAIQPTAVVVDEDATPLKRIAIALARNHGAASMVVQHGAPCGPFGFAPLAADQIAVWGDSARRQLQAWAVPARRIRVTGWPSVRRRLLTQEPLRRRTAGGTRFLLLATMPPRDERPDNVDFHLTSQNYAAMLDMVGQVLRRIGAAALTIKLHPRAVAEDPAVLSLRGALSGAARVRVVRSGDLPALIAANDCVLSCASTAGIEAALAGAPVVQLLPAGSGNILPSEDWGFVGSARTAEQLGMLVEQALSRGWRTDPSMAERIVAAQGRNAARNIADALAAPLGCSVNQSAGAQNALYVGDSQTPVLQ